MKPSFETIRLASVLSMCMKIGLISMHDPWPKLAVFSFDASENWSPLKKDAMKVVQDWNLHQN